MNVKFLTAQEVAERYQISKTLVHKLVRSGNFPRGIHFGKAHRWNEQELEAWEANLQEAR